MIETKRTHAVALAIVCAACVVTPVGCGSSGNTYEPPPPPDVTVTNPVRSEVSPFLERNGETEAAEQAEVRARVSGFIQAIEFKPGQEVKQGDVLYRIEPDFYQAAVNSRKAAVAAAESSIGVAEALVKTGEAEVTNTAQNLSREKSLLAQGAGSQFDLDAAEAASAAAIAAVEAAKADVEEAQALKGREEADLAKAELDLGYTIVRAPISGRITKTLVKLGNLVQEGTSLAAVIDDTTIFANFSVSDREALELQAARLEQLPDDARADVDAWRGVPVFMARETDDGFPFQGGIDNVDQQGVDVETGTIGIRASFDNGNGRILPGLFVTIRAPYAAPYEALLVPELATLKDQLGTFVLTVNSAGKVERTPVVLGMKSSGWVVVRSGLSDDARVIISGQQRAVPGIEVKPMSETLAFDSQKFMQGFSIGSGAEPVEERQAEDSEATDNSETSR